MIEKLQEEGKKLALLIEAIIENEEKYFKHNKENWKIEFLPDNALEKKLLEHKSYDRIFVYRKISVITAKAFFLERTKKPLSFDNPNVEILNLCLFHRYK